MAFGQYSKEMLSVCIYNLKKNKNNSRESAVDALHLQLRHHFRDVGARESVIRLDALLPLARLLLHVRVRLTSVYIYIFIYNGAITMALHDQLAECFF